MIDAFHRARLAFPRPLAGTAGLAVGALVLALLACGPSGTRDVGSVNLARPDGAAGSAGSAGRGGRGGSGSGGSGGNTAGGEMTGGTGTPAPDGGGGTSASDGASDPDTSAPGGATDAGVPEAPAPDAALSAVGMACANAGQCQSGQCVDGVCCATACGMPCHACDVAGKVGQCAPVPAGSDPGNHCEPEAAASCGRDGSCDGSGGCRRFPAGTECVPGSCMGAIERAARTCDGSGTCRPGAMRSCAPNVCMGTSCGTRCTDASQCQTGFFCAAGACQLRRPTGQTCTTPGECASGQCVDGICCATACGQACFACNLPGTVGTCSPVAAGQDPGNDCPEDAASSCQRDGTCNGRGGCRLHAATVMCAAAACAESSATPARLCNGLGVCPAAAATSCSPFVCGASACKTACESASDCQPRFTCREGRCVSDGLVLHWKFDEAEGTVAEDASGNALRGTYTGTTGTPTPAVEVPASRFTNPRSRAFALASRQAVQLANMPAALKPTRELTLAAFYRATRVDSGGGGEVISGGNNYLLRVRTNDIEVSKRIGGSNGWVRCCFGVVTDHLNGQFHHIATVIDGVTAKVYFDGVEKCSLNNTAAMAYDRGNDLFVGRHGEDGDQFDFDGHIDEVRIYSRALSATEIAALAAGEN